jgi:DNA invertase Pin-like site-specific DNA recombinase
LVHKEYKDGGFTGANTCRPGFQQLFKDIEAGEIDAVVVYKIDRLSRSLRDFGRLMETFERREVSFVSVTQQFNTGSSMGKLTLNILMSFAEFEREVISERTRDKVAGARRRGKWTGGTVILGFRLENHRLAIVQEEADVVRQIFGLYLRTRSLGIVAEKLNSLGHRQKTYVTSAGRTIGGRAWDKYSVQRILRNPLYSGRVKQDGILHPGEHEAIIHADTFDRVQESLEERSTGHGHRKSRKSEFLLTGLLHCGACNCAMTSSLARGRNETRYRYYRCTSHNEGKRCPTGLLPAAEIEAAVIDEVRKVALDGELKVRILEQLARKDGIEADLVSRKEHLEKHLSTLNVEGKRLLDALKGADPGGKLVAGRLGELEEEMDSVRRQIDEVEGQLRALEYTRHDATWVTSVLEKFDEVWEALLPAERRDLLHLFVRRISVDGGACEIAFHDHGVPS